MAAFIAEHFINIVGIVGVAMVLSAYAALQLQKIDSRTVAYSLLNTIGSILILISLCYSWNLASGIIEIAWLLISLYSLVRALWLRYQQVSN